MKKALTTLILITAFASSSYALPALQLGPGTGDWVYDTGSDTWVTSTNPFSVFTYANALTGSGAFAWDPAGGTDKKAYFVVSAVPMVAFDAFDVSVSDDGGALTLVSSGFGTPPVTDTNSVAPHGIFDTWFEVYEFQFNGPVVPISNTQPPGSGTSDGYAEEVFVTINSLEPGISGVHMDLFTMEGDGDILTNTNMSKAAPFSHDAQNNIPEPGSLLLLSLGVVGVGVARWRRR